MYKTLLTLAASLLLSLCIHAQISFTDETSVLLSNTNIYSGAPIGIADMNGDSLDDIIRLNAASDLSIAYQQSDGSQFTNFVYGNLGPGKEWGLCIADVDANGFNDILAGGAYNELKLMMANSTGTSYTLEELTDPSVFLQGVNFVDIDNNGTTDIFACHDDGLSAPFSNDGSGNFVHDETLIDASSSIPSDNSGNYGSIWTDYDNDGDLDLYISKCRGGVNDPMDGRRINLLFQNDGNNNFVDVAQAAGLRPLAQSWASDFGDIDNDGDLDCFIINHDMDCQIYWNNGDGTFTDFTDTSGMADELDLVGGGIQCIFDDFNNDCFVDLLLTTINGGHRLFQNDGDGTFTNIVDPFPTNFGIHSAATGDLNNDGFLDVYAGFAVGYNSPNSSRPDKLYINSGNSNNYLRLLLKGANANINAIGAQADIYGAWGVQTREVRSGEGYGIMNSFALHFGLGTATVIDSLIIRWPNGTEEKMCGLPINQCLTLEENNLPDLLEADFNYTETALEVSFSDNSSGVADSWSWDFGDGATSLLQNPVHTFPGIGPYTVMLTIANDCESNTYSYEWVQGALPLELLSFRAELIEKDQVALRWITSHEEDFDYFDLERTNDFELIKSIGQVAGTNNMGINNYDWIDRFPTPGKNYYRLRQVDLDGTFEYSQWAEALIKVAENKLLIYPNPVRDKLYVETGNWQAEIVKVFNTAGVLILEKKQVASRYELDVSGWMQGVYFLHVLDRNGEWKVLQVVK